MAATQSNRLVNGRLEYIDSLRGLAVLLMVMVHAAATWSPSTASQQSIIGYVAAGLGGLAAPLFVVLFGWSISKSELTNRKIAVRAGVLFAAQILLNSIAPHLFNVFTPGILSLFAILIITAPLWLKISRWQVMPGLPFWLILLPLLCSTSFLLPNMMGGSTWDSRVETSNIGQIISHLFFTGLYPLIPWLAFAIFGALIAENYSFVPQTVYRERLTWTMMLGGCMFCVASIQYALVNNLDWAAPTANADSNSTVLTFFPANAAFLIAAMTGVGLLWLLFKKVTNTKSLNILGQFSLSVYILHFIPLSLARDFEVEYEWSIIGSAIMVILYTLCWWPLAIIWNKKAKKWSLEYLLAKYSK